MERHYTASMVARHSGNSRQFCRTRTIRCHRAPNLEHAYQCEGGSSKRCCCGRAITNFGVWVNRWHACALAWFASLGYCCGKQGDSPRINQLFGSMAHPIRASWFAFTAWLACAILCLSSQPVLGRLFHVLYSTETSYNCRRLPHSIAKPSRDLRVDVLCTH